jgi:hypothetical protein
MTKPGIETATFLLLAQCLNKLRHRAPSKINVSLKINGWTKSEDRILLQYVMHYHITSVYHALSS